MQLWFRFGWRTAVVGALAVLATVAASARAAVYTFTQVAPPSGPVQPLGLGSINNDGRVAFLGRTSLDDIGIYTASGGAVSPVLTDAGPFRTFDSVRINDAGTIAFYGVTDAEQEGFYTLPAGGTTPTPVLPPGYADFGHSFAFNNRGDVAFKALRVADSRYGYFVTNGGATSTIFTWSGDSDPTNPLPSLSDGGTVAFTSPLVVGGGQIYTGNGTAPATSTGLEGGQPSINNAGRIAYRGNPGTDADGIIATTAGGGRVLIAGGDDRLTLFGSPSINENGDVAFVAARAAPSTGLNGVYVGDGARLDKVLAPGDTLFGRTVSEVFFEPGNLNDIGQLLVGYRASDGSVGMVVATPVPEPTTLWPVGACTALLARMRRPRTERS